MDYIGGFITKNPTVPTASAAPGIWKLAQAVQYIKAGTWPVPVVEEIMTFNGSATWTAPTGVTSVDYLVVAGGGSGGSGTGGGGGAGGNSSGGGQAGGSGVIVIRYSDVL